jgi:hypothetical protein
MGMLFIVFAVSMAMATFLENDFGSAYAYSKVYGTRWFELILLLLAINLIGRMIALKLYRKDKLPIFVFHLSFVIMIIGAGITRYFGWEGTLHIREGKEQNISYSGQKYIEYNVKDPNGNLITSYSEEYLIAAGGNFKKKIAVGEKEYELILARIIPNALETVTESADGIPIISLMVGRDMMSTETVILKKGETKSAMGISIGFESADHSDVNIKTDSAGFFMSSDKTLNEHSMMTGESKPIESGTKVRLKKMQLFMLNDVRIAPQQMFLSGTRKIVAVNPEDQNTGQNAFIFHVFSGKTSGTVTLWDASSGMADAGSCVVDDITFNISYGSRANTLPFKLKLNDFVLERYPGSASPSGYRSKVVLIDSAKNFEKPFEKETE